MTIPSNISFSASRQRLSVRCTCDNLDVITVTLKKTQVTNPRQPYRIAENPHDGRFFYHPPATESDVQWYLLGLVESGRIPMTKAKSMLHALQDKDLRSIDGDLVAQGYWRQMSRSKATKKREEKNRSEETRS